MKRLSNQWLVAVLLPAVCSVALPQGNSNAMKSPALVQDPCKSDVLRYQADIDFVRKALGDKAAAEQEDKFMQKKQWNAVLLDEGYCGISRRLREKKLVK